MEQNDDLKKIKRDYGEMFMHLCRSFFPTILEQPGKLYEIISSSFGTNSRTLGEDIVRHHLEGQFKNYVYGKMKLEHKEEISTGETPYELLERAGYVLTECKTEKEIQGFKKYYEQDEELCSFDGGRLNSCLVFFAVRKDVDTIKRKDFKHPEREDKYGTSVMSIQFNRQGICTVSIKNRYNHTVDNPDATYGNDLDKIIPGLKKSFEALLAERGLLLSHDNVEKIMFPDYTVAGDGKYYKINYEKDGIYYGPGNIVIQDGEVKKLPNHQILIDSYVVDTKGQGKQRKPTIREYRSNSKNKDSFVDDLKEIEKIEVKKKEEGENGEKSIFIYKKDVEKPIIIDIDKENRIIGYTNEGLKKVKDNFLDGNTELRVLNTPNLESMGHNCLGSNTELEVFRMPSLQSSGDGLLEHNRKLRVLDAPRAVRLGHDNFRSNRGLQEINLPNVEEIGDYFAEYNEDATSVIMPKAKIIGHTFMANNNQVHSLDFKNLRVVGDDFFLNNNQVHFFNAPNLRKIGETGFWDLEQNIETVNCPRHVKRKMGLEKTLTSHDYARLDEQSELTTTKVGFGRNLLNKILEIRRDMKGGRDSK